MMPLYISNVCHCCLCITFEETRSFPFWVIFSNTYILLFCDEKETRYNNMKKEKRCTLLS